MNRAARAPDPATPAWPLTEAQSGLWYAQRLAPDNPAFNTAHALWIDGPLDRDAFVAAADQLAGEADALALAMRDEAGGPLQWIDQARRPWLEVVTDAGSDEEAVRAAMRRDMLAPVDPARDRLALQRLYVLGPRRHAWYLRVHHLAIDGYGMELLTSRLAELYAARLAGAASPAAALAPLRRVLEEDADYRDSSGRAQDGAYWREYMTPPPEVSGLAPARATGASACIRSTVALPEPLRARLLDRAGAVGQTWPDLLTALTALYCQRMAGAAEFVAGVPFMGRLGRASAKVPAMVMNVLPLRVAPDPERPLDDWIRQVARQLVRARRHGRYRSEQLRRDLGLLGGQRRLYGPLINVQPFYRPPALQGASAALEVLGTGPVDDLTLGFRGDGHRQLDLEIEANPELHSGDDVDGHARRLLAFLDAALDAPTPADIPLASPEEVRRYLFEVNATAHPVPDATLAALLEAAMAHTPAAEALVFGNERLDYAALERRSRRLAAELRRRGIGRESIVAVALPRSLELVIALVAVLRAGGAYLPLDLDHPPERTARILRSAAPACILTRAEDAGRWPAPLPQLHCEDWALLPEAALPESPRPGDAAYVIYTSGSTGEPKGVVVEHRAIVNRLEWMRRHYGFESGDRILQKTPMTFDVSVWEFFLAFLAGGTLVVAPPDAHRDPQALARLVREHAITTLHFVPSMLAAFLADPASAGLRVRRVFCSGEELSADLRDRFHATLRAELHNLYGPTEAAVDVSHWPAPADDRSMPVPIGFPVWNTRLYVLDTRMRALPPGVAGDLYIGGVQLARGYLGQPELTAERFIDDPFVPGERMYRTGDCARWRGDGAAVFLGRSDQQIKLRGLRIEPGEIEAAIHDSGLVLRADVILREDRAGERRLVAYVQCSGRFDPHALRAEVAARVPDYMVPVAFVALEHWPLTQNGKLDRKALPAPDFDASAGPEPRTPSEAGVADLFAELLNLHGAVGADADFFSLGGDSLLAVELLLRIQQRWQRNPGLGALFAAPTVAGLARLIDAGPSGSDDGLAPVIRLRPGDETLAPLFVIHPAGGIAWCYRELARSLSPARPVYGLQAPALDPAQPVPDSIDALASDYARRILELCPRGVVHLAGWSVGGILAQAIAVRLNEAGRDTGLVAMFDAYPSECWRAEPEPSPAMALRALLAVAGYDPEQHPELDSREAIVDFLRRGDSALGNLPDAALEGVVRVVTETNRLIRGHYHSRYPGVLTHIRAGLDHAGRDALRPELWAPYAGQLERLEVPFLHAQLTGRDATAAIAPLLDLRLRAWDAGRQPETSIRAEEQTRCS